MDGRPQSRERVRLPHRFHNYTNDSQRSGRAVVPLVKSTEHGLRAHHADSLDLAWHRRVPVERLVRARAVVALDVLTERAEAMASSKRDDVVGALTSNRTDDALSEGVLPGGAWS